MAFEWIYLVALFNLAFGESICPKPQDLLPCTCDYEGVNCLNAKTSEEIKQAFRALFPFGGARAVWVQGTPITEVIPNMFGIIKIREFYIEMNNVSKVDLKAFKEASSQLMQLSFFGNKIVDFPYSDLKDLPRLSRLNLGRNLIETIPDGAFESPLLASLILIDNRIKHIGMNAFANLPKLSVLQLQKNQIVNLGPMALAFKSHGPRLQIHLGENKIANISSSTFQGADPELIDLMYNQLTSLKKDPFEKLVIKVKNQMGYIQLYGNPLSCSGCDYSWITLNKNSLAEILDGFMCEDGSSIHDLTKTKIGCHS